MAMAMAMAVAATMALEAATADQAGGGGASNVEQCSDDDILVRDITPTIFVIGYQEPDVAWYDDDDIDTLRRVHRNDNTIQGLSVYLNYTRVCDKRNDFDGNHGGNNSAGSSLAERVGHAIGNNTHLRKLRLETSLHRRHVTDYLTDVTSFFTGLARNQSIEYLELGDVHPKSIGSFIRNNSNLRCIKSMYPCGEEFIPSITSTLLESKVNRFERICLSQTEVADDVLADLINALNAASGLCNLSDLEVGWNKTLARKGCKALGQLLENSKCQLHSLTLSATGINDKSIEILTRGLLMCNTIKILHIGYLARVTPIGWRSFFSTYLAISKCSLQTIDLSDNNIGDDGLICLGQSIVSNVNSKLTGLELQEPELYQEYNTKKKCRYTTVGWSGFSSAMLVGAPTSKIVKLDLTGADMNDEGGTAVMSALVKLPSLKSVNLWDTSIGASGWASCFQLMIDNGFTFEELILTENNIDDVSAALLFESLGSNKTLKILDLKDNRDITTAGWIACFCLLLDSGSSVEKLILDTNNIDDEGAALLVNFLARSSEVSCVNIRGNPLIHIDGWRLFADSLHLTSSSKLKELIIGSKGRLLKEMIDNLIATFSHLLGGNTTIEVLKLCNYEKVTNTGWSALSNALCNKSSIADIYSSNHTLHTMEDVILRGNSVTDRLPFDILSLLRLNHNKHKGEVIRFKILKYFLSDAANVGPTFANVATTVIPNAIGWIGKDSLGFSVMFDLVQGMPWLLDSTIKEDAESIGPPPAKILKVE